MRKKDKRRLKLCVEMLGELAATLSLVYGRVAKIDDRTKTLLELVQPPDVFEKFGQMSLEERIARIAARRKAAGQKATPDE